METNSIKSTTGLQVAQIAWVVKDINVAEKFFKDVMGISHFHKMENFRVEGIYYGKPVEWVSHVCMTWSGGTFIEIIQPVSGTSIFHDYLDKHPEGGMQHVAYSIPVAELDNVISDFSNKGYSIITSVDTTIAKIVFFDTYKELGVLTEVMGITEEGVKAVEKMKTPVP